MKEHTKKGPLSAKYRKTYPNWMMFLFLAILCNSLQSLAQTNNAGISSLQNPALSTCPGTYIVKVTLKNNGSNVLTYGTIEWEWNGTTQTPVSWTDTLNSSDSTTVDLGTVTCLPGKDYLKTWPASVNGKANAGGPGNDTLYATIIVNALPSASAGANASICSGSSTSIGGTASAGITYSWTSSPSGFTSTTGSPSVSPTATTKYYLTETNPTRGCSAKDSTVITVNPSPNADAGNNETICTGNSVTLGAPPVSGSAYVWVSTPSGFTSTVSNPTVSPKTTTSYTITAINSYGCVNANSVTVTIGSCPKTSAANDAGIGAITSPTSTFCGNLQTVHVRLKNYGTNELDSVKIGWSVNRITQITVNWKGKLKTGDTAFVILDSANFPSGTDTVKAWTFHPNGFIDSIPQNDTSLAAVISYPVTINTGKSRFVCPGGIDTLGAPSVSGNTYKWISNGSNFSTISNPVVSPINTTTYELFETNKYGCEGFSTVTISIVSAGFSFTKSCPGDSTVFTNPDSISTSYKWSFGDGKGSTAKNPSHLYTGLGSYHVTLKDSSAGCSDTASKTVTISTCVWPGDANFDKVDNINDILAIGVAYNDSGSKRTDTTTQWYAHPCTDWSKSFASGVNHKHADCNGDGKVDLLDVGAIVSNYSLTHSKTSGTTGGNPSDPALFLTINKDSVGTADTLSIQMNLGTPTKSVSNIYGICFSIIYDPMNVNQSKGITADFSKCWLGTLNKGLIYVVHNDSAKGLLDIGLVRTGHTNISGYGPLGVITIITPDNVGGKREVKNELHFNVENVKAIDFAEDDISLYTVGDSTLFYGYSSGIEPLDQGLNQVRVYPNPASSILHLDAGQDFISGITVSNMLGEKVLSQKCTRLQQMDLNTESLVPGTYFIDIHTENGIAWARFVKE